MSAALVLSVLAGVTAYAITDRLARAKPGVNWIDRPNERSLHSTPTPRTGGLGVFAGVYVGVVLAAFAAFLGGDADSPLVSGEWVWIGALTVAVGLVSVWDDRRGLPIAVRLLAHVVAAAGAVWGGGLVLTAIHIPMLGVLQLGVLAAPVSLLGIVWMTNLYNFMDGMDGFAGGMSVVGFAMLGAVAASGGHRSLAVVAFVIAAAAFGFVIHNVPPARIFMGDVGAVPLGFLASTLSIIGVRDGSFDVWVPVLVFSPFVVDATTTLLRRMARGEAFWRAHREHYYQRLVLAGWGHRRTVGAEWVLMAGCSLSAGLYHAMPDEARVVLLGLWVAIYAGLIGVVRAVERRAPVDRSVRA